MRKYIPFIALIVISILIGCGGSTSPSKANITLGWNKFEKNLLDEAFNAFSNALVVGEDSLEANLGMSWVKIQKGELLSAENYINACAEIDSSSSNVIATKGVIKYLRADYNSAISNIVAVLGSNYSQSYSFERIDNMTDRYLKILLGLSYCYTDYLQNAQALLDMLDPNNGLAYDDTHSPYYINQLLGRFEDMLENYSP